MSLCPKCGKCTACCQISTCGRPSAKLLAGLALSGFKSKGSVYTKGRVFPTLQSKTPPPPFPVKVTSDSQWIHRSSQKQASERVLDSLSSKTDGRKGCSSHFCGFLQLVISGTKAKQQVEANSGSQLNLYLATASFKMETPETIRLSLQKGDWVTSLDFSDAYFHIPISQRSRKFLRFHLNGQTYQLTALPFGLSTAPLEFTKVAKKVKLMAQARGIQIHQYLDDWLLRAPCPETCERHTQKLLDPCRNLGWMTLSQKINLLLGQETCSVRQFISLIGLLTATEKQVVSGYLHMRPILWHLKKHWHVPEVLEKVIPLPKSLHVHLKWWLDPNKVLKGQPLHPYALQLFTDASNEGWGAHLGDCTAKGLWSKPEGDLHINLLKGGFVSPKTVRALCDGPGTFRVTWMSLPTNCPDTNRWFRQSGLSFKRFSTYSANDGTNQRWIFLQPGSIANFQGLCHQYRTGWLGR